MPHLAHTASARGSRSGRLVIAALLLLLAGRAAAAVGTWTAVPSAPADLQTMLLLTDGTVIGVPGNVSTSQHWYRLTPSSTGDYATGTWAPTALAHDTRLYFGSVVMRDGRLFVAGGEYGSGARTVEIYDPKADTWTSVAGFPGPGGIGDSTAALLDDGRVLLLANWAPKAFVYDPVTGAWTTTSLKPNHEPNDEESVVKLPDGSYLIPSTWSPPSALRYFPATDQWVDPGPTPASLVDTSDGEIGPGVLLYDGRAMFLGATGITAFFGTGTGAWATGPNIPDNRKSDDCPAAVMPNGHVLLVTDAGGLKGPSAFYEFDPTTATYAAVPAPAGADMTHEGEFDRMLVLPTGQVADTIFGKLWLYTPVGGANAAWRPTITALTDLGGGSYRLAGKQLNGLTEGAYYGDDAQSSSNYPLVRLRNGAGQVRYARTANHSTMGVATGAATVTTDLTLPALADGAYSLEAVANGVASNPLLVTISGGRIVTGPVVALTAPADGASATAPATIALTATASDLLGSISKVEFFHDGVLIGTDASGADGWGLGWSNVPAGSYALTVKATAMDGATATSAVVHVTVNAALTPPTITTQPTNRTVTAGAIATFTVAASGSAPLSYQWQRSGADIAGATSASHTTPATTVADSGATFRCVVTNGAGSATSNPATLTVNASGGGGGGGGDTVWIEDAIPAGGSPGSDNGDSWTWVGTSPTPFSGTLCQQSSIAAGEHQHYFTGATATLAVGTGEVLIAYVYLDPANSPSEVMIQWNVGGSWEHRAYWGANSIAFGSDNTGSRHPMGALPATGRWVRLEVPASSVGLQGATLSGMAFTQFGGRTWFDHVGKAASASATLNGADVGSPSPAGSTSGSGANWTVTGAGTDIWGTSDSFQFASSTLSGDGQIVARVASMTATDPWAKAGVMIRATSTANSAYAMVAVTPSHGIDFQRRLTAGGSSSYTAGSLVHAPYWVKLNRVGATITAYQSADGTTWRLVGSQNIAMGASVLVGLAVTSHHQGALCTAVFDHVAVIAGPVGSG